jgi:mannose-6-phosphate isomerase-like protein (cupin superfamily)
LSSHESFLGSAVAALYERRILIVFVESAASMTSEMSVALSRFCLDSETTMKSLFNGSLPRAGLLLLFSSGAILPLTAAERKQARITRVVRDVSLLAPHIAARPARLNDDVTNGSAVHTGADSRAELTFADLTITRVGANSIFSFDQDGRNVSVESGAILLRVPKGSGGARIRSSALTVGITGTTVMFESRPRNYSKLIVLEGSGQAWLTKHPEKKITVHAGQMVIVKPGAAHLPEPVDIDESLVLRTAILITEFPPLPSLDLMRSVAENQKKSGGPLLNPLIDPTGMGARDVNASTRPQPTPHRTPGDGQRKP